MTQSKLLNLNEPLIIAIDGTAASGKGTIAALMAEKFSLIHCQTSLFYRALAYEVLSKKLENSEKEIINLSKNYHAIPNASSALYTPEVTKLTSIISAIPEVRKNLIKPQQDFFLHNKRVVMEGRDIGTVIAPHADLKLFITADLNIRAERRYKQMKGSIALDLITEDLENRDLRDSTRTASPLAKASDAIEIDTSTHSPEEIIHMISSYL